MDWLAAGINGPLVAIRALHFTATAMVAGALVFRAVVAEPALRSTKLTPVPIRLQTSRVAWISLAIALATGVIWVLLEAASMSGLAFTATVTWDVLSTVLNQTQFGQVAEIRCALAIILAGCLAYDRFALPRWLGLGAALALMAAIAWTGHAGSTPGETGNLHLIADTLHLCGAAAWLGGLVSLVLLLTGSTRNPTIEGLSLAQLALKRFSSLGIVSVATLSVTGLVNAWILVGSFHALVISEYGRLLMLKLVVLALMLGFAAVNRFWLTPALAFSSGNELRLDIVRRLTRNSIIEIALGVTIFAIVGVLGTLHPAIHGL
jgi:putative copper resistance protein D